MSSVFIDDSCRAGFCPQTGCFRNVNGILNGILKFTDISRPGVILENLKKGFIDASNVLISFSLYFTMKERQGRQNRPFFLEGEALYRQDVGVDNIDLI